MRDLKKAQRERVYARTLVRVRFPDRTCVQGFFHPRQTVRDVYAWVKDDCLCPEVSASASASSGKLSAAARARGVPAAPPGGADYLSTFELYTSPPRCVLHPYLPTSVQPDEDNVFQVSLVSPLIGALYIPYIATKI